MTLARGASLSRSRPFGDAPLRGLVDLDVAGAGVGADGGSSTVDDAGDVMTVQAALHGDGL